MARYEGRLDIAPHICFVHVMPNMNLVVPALSASTLSVLKHLTLSTGLCIFRGIVVVVAVFIPLLSAFPCR